MTGGVVSEKSTLMIWTPLSTYAVTAMYVLPSDNWKVVMPTESASSKFALSAI